MTETQGVDKRHVPRTAASEFAFKQFGGQVTILEDVVTVGAAVTRLLVNNSERVFWMMQNLSASDIRIQWKQEVAVGV